jgi:hypothetical protein
MKTIFAIAAFACCVSSAFAQSGATSQPANPAATTAMAAPGGAPASPGAQAGGWVPPYGQPVAEKTRAQVYQELVEAEKDGQLAYLNSTLYAH